MDNPEILARLSAQDTERRQTKQKELTSRLLDYLPNALAFIYVINSSNAGGLQGDRVDILSFCFVSHF
jgi:hypothetical protein